MFSTSCPVSTWHDDVIIATLPTGIDALLQGKKKDAILRVKTAKGTASKGVSIVPSAGVDSPLIDVVPDKVSPGEKMVISGKQFGVSVGKVDLVSVGLSPISCRVVSWTDNLIYVEVPADASWNQFADATVSVQPHKTDPGAPDVNAEKAIQFEPRLVRRVYVKNLLVEGRATKKETKILSAFGRDLINGWRVTTVHKDYVEDTGVVVRWLERPKPGGTKTKCKVRAVKPKGYKRYGLTLVLVVEGPRGTSPF